MKENSYIAPFMMTSKRACRGEPGSVLGTQESPVRDGPYFYELAGKIYACRIYVRGNLSEQAVAWILQPSTVGDGIFVGNIIAEDSTYPKNSNLN